MTREMSQTQKAITAPTLMITAAIAGVAGAALGAVALGVGVYLASYSDRLVPFYFAGAFAGFATSVAYTILRLWSQGHLSRERTRGVLAALLGAFVAWVQLAAPALGMSLGERTIASTVWLGGWTLLLLFIGRKNTSVAGGSH